MVPKWGYSGFGSFHSDNVQELITQDASIYEPPLLPFPAPTLPRQPQFGTAIRSQFMIDFDDWTFLNHGAFGGVLRPVYDAADALRRHCEKQPLLFLDRYVTTANLLVAHRQQTHHLVDDLVLCHHVLCCRELFPQLVRVTREMGRFVQCRPQV